MSELIHSINFYFPNCRNRLGSTAWDGWLAALGISDPGQVGAALRSTPMDDRMPAWTADAVDVEWQIQRLDREGEPAHSSKGDGYGINPRLALVPVQWEGICHWLGYAGDSSKLPREKPGHVLIWCPPGQTQVRCRDAADEDLLALKLVAEEQDVREAARMGKVPVSKILAVLYRAVDQGILLAPESRIRRKALKEAPQAFTMAEVFTLQWHITQTCDLNCRHCYDRSSRQEMPLAQGLTILEDLYAFTADMGVKGHVSFTGGNPFFYPHFMPLYRAAGEMGFSTAILGNPVAPELVDRVQEIQPLSHYQISLEGLEGYNDYIRGKGHFRRAMDFLEVLASRDVYAMVMLTLNRDNMDQVLPLGERLRDRANAFTFNRLAMVGQGAQLALPSPGKFQSFLWEYRAAAVGNPVMTLKDNFFNILACEANEETGGGCTGFGCGAAFNFVSLLSDGEVHACRKLPSPLGNIKDNRLYDLYHSPAARAYREGPRACQGCDLSLQCRGCPAVANGMGLDPLEDRDPFCFYSHAP